MTTFYGPTDDWATWSLRNINRRPATTGAVTAVAPYPAYTPLRDTLPPPPRTTAAQDDERRLREDRRRNDQPVLFDRRSGDDRRALNSIAPRIDIYC